MLDALIVPRTRELGDGFEVRRALPAARRRSVGPFVFFDQMGPVALDMPARVLFLGGEPLEGERFVWWNFVSSRKERIAPGIVNYP